MLYENDMTQFIVEYRGKERENMIQQKRMPTMSQKEVLEHSLKLIDEVTNLYQNYRFQSNVNDKEIIHYATQQLVSTLIETENLNYSVTQHRTFGQNIPKRDKLLFPQLEALEKFDISYTIYSYLEILDWGKPYDENDTQ